MRKNIFFNYISRVDGFSVVAIGQTLSYINRLSDLQSWSYRKPSCPEESYDTRYLLCEYLKQIIDKIIEYSQNYIHASTDYISGGDIFTNQIDLGDNITSTIPPIRCFNSGLCSNNKKELLMLLISKEELNEECNRDQNIRVYGLNNIILENAHDIIQYMEDNNIDYLLYNAVEYVNKKFSIDHGIGHLSVVDMTNNGELCRTSINIAALENAFKKGAINYKHILEDHPERLQGILYLDRSYAEKIYNKLVNEYPDLNQDRIMELCSDIELSENDFKLKLDQIFEDALKRLKRDSSLAIPVGLNNSNKVYEKNVKGSFLIPLYKTPNEDKPFGAMVAMCIVKTNESKAKRQEGTTEESADYDSCMYRLDTFYTLDMALEDTLAYVHLKKEIWCNPNR